LVKVFVLWANTIVELWFGLLRCSVHVHMPIGMHMHIALSTAAVHRQTFSFSDTSVRIQLYYEILNVPNFLNKDICYKNGQFN
jgi:L-alanine-DL-glutamate epimerase-like enolase superfamily enzyme